ncbi:MAG: NUDIX domain-containing protein [candidate division Zixibacteria bacterium]|nr:NUDIX domain-containing protein [candidate division Zixibacteria bacterium]
MNNTKRIRVIAICVFRHEDSIFVGEGIDDVKQESFYRPLGGGVEFGETGRDAIVREIAEEINAGICALRYIETIENIFVHNGQPMHEIVLVYEGQFSDDSYYDSSGSIVGDEEGMAFKATWVPLEEFRERKKILYPSGLLELLDRKAEGPGETL